MAFTKVRNSMLVQPVNRNLIINGAMQVAQWAKIATGMTSTAYGTVDRFRTFMKANGAGTWTQTQEEDGPSGFSNSLKLECTVASTSLVADSYLFLSQAIEAQNLQHLEYGSSDAKTLTLSFWVKSNKTGTYVFELQHQDATSNNGNSHQYSISAANTWEHKTITIGGQTSDTIDNNNEAGLNVYFWILAGVDYSGGTYSEDTWQGTGENRAVGQVNLADKVGNTFQITGVKLEVGNIATPFEHRSYGEELALCQRYYYEQRRYGRRGGGIFTRNINMSQGCIYLPQTMRVPPTFTGNLTQSDGFWVGSTFSASNGYTQAARVDSVDVQTTANIDEGSGNGGTFAASFKFDAEL